MPFTPFFLFVIGTSAMEIPKRANMLYLSKEASTKDQKLKMQMLFSTGNSTKNAEFVWKHNGFFGDQKRELTLFKRNFPENTLIYVNQGQTLWLRATLQFI